MRYFPVFLDLKGKRVLVSGGGETAVAKLRLLLKTEASVTVFSGSPHPKILEWAKDRRVRLARRPVQPEDMDGAFAAYAASDDDGEGRRVSGMARASGVLVNAVDNPARCDFITPAIVDRDPVVVAIGTEGTAPVLARKIKAMLEESLSPRLGALAEAGRRFRAKVESLSGKSRRGFWRKYYDQEGPKAMAESGESGLEAALEALLESHAREVPAAGRVWFVGAGPGDPELLTLKARKLLDGADVIIHDRLVAPEILELARREAIVIEVGKTGFGPGWRQADINQLLVEHASAGASVVRLKSGDPALFGRLNEEIEALDQGGVEWTVVPGVTSASAAAASMGNSLTQRGRNSSVTFIAGHDASGLAEHDWASLARPGAITAVYMARHSARFIQGRLLMHGADRSMPVSVVVSASRPGEKAIPTTVGRMSADMKLAGADGPALLILGLSPDSRRAAPAEARTMEAAL